MTVDCRGIRRPSRNAQRRNARQARVPGSGLPATNGRGPARTAASAGDASGAATIRATAVTRGQSACLRRNAGISISSMPLLASASTLAAAVRPLRQTLGVVSAL